MVSKKYIAATLVVSLLVFTFPAVAGTVSGKIQVSGTKLKTEGAKPDKDVIVYLEKDGDAKYPDPPAKHALIDQKSLVFIPHVLPIQKGTAVDFLNSDTTEHNVFCVDDCCKIVEDINAKKPKFLDLGNFPGGEKAAFTFGEAGTGVILCKLHPEMAAYIVVLDTPFFTIASLDGSSQSATYTLKNIPAGDYVVKVWNKRCEAPGQSLTVTKDGETKADIEIQKKVRKKRSRR